METKMDAKNQDSDDIYSFIKTKEAQSLKPTIPYTYSCYNVKSYIDSYSQVMNAIAYPLLITVGQWKVIHLQRSPPKTQKTTFENVYMKTWYHVFMNMINWLRLHVQDDEFVFFVSSYATEILYWATQPQVLYKIRKYYTKDNIMSLNIHLIRQLEKVLFTKDSRPYAYRGWINHSLDNLVWFPKSPKAIDWHLDCHDYDCPWCNVFEGLMECYLPLKWQQIRESNNSPHMIRQYARPFMMVEQAIQRYLFLENTNIRMIELKEYHQQAKESMEQEKQKPDILDITQVIQNNLIFYIKHRNEQKKALEQ